MTSIWYRIHQVSSLLVIATYRSLMRQWRYDQLTGTSDHHHLHHGTFTHVVCDIESCYIGRLCDGVLCHLFISCCRHAVRFGKGRDNYLIMCEKAPSVVLIWIKKGTSGLNDGRPSENIENYILNNKRLNLGHTAFRPKPNIDIFNYFVRLGFSAWQR